MRIMDTGRSYRKEDQQIRKNNADFYYVNLLRREN